MKNKILTCCITAILLLFPLITINAKTVGQLETELNRLQQQEEDKENQIHQTQGEINKTKGQINNIYSQMEKIQNDIIAKTEESNQLQRDIEKKNEESKELMRYFQISSGESAFLEYAMGAKSLTDFIYRLSIIEQLSKYNDETIKEMNKMIVNNEKIKKELADKEIELTSLKQDLGVKLSSLGNTISDLSEESQTLLESIKNSQSVIKMYKDAGCKTNDEINVCASKQLPPDTSFWRPLIKGYVTSNYGARSLGYHFGIDISIGTGIGTPIYAAANGKVVKTIYGSSSGGNQIIVHHNINGKYYTTYYAHLNAIYVKAGQLVSKDTVLGEMGNTGRSTGPHLHLGIATGLWYSQYYSYSDYVARTQNPRNIINFTPGYYKTWVNRTTKY